MHKVPLHVYKFYSLCKHLSHSHTNLYALSHKCHRSSSMIYDKCHAFRSHCQSVTLSMCCLDSLMCLIIESCWVCIYKVMYEQVHSLTHLVILLKFWRPDHPPIVRPSLSCIAQFHPLVNMYFCPELRKDWGCLQESVHCVILESTGPTVTQNNAEVS